MYLTVDDICGYCCQCGRPLFPRRRDAKTCSLKCRVRLWRKRHGRTTWPDAIRYQLARVGTVTPVFIKSKDDVKG